MANIPSAPDLFTALAFIVPGFIIVRTREQFIAGRKQAVSEDLLEYIVYGAINFAAFSWLIFLLNRAEWSAEQAAFGWFVVVLLGPVCLGALMGVTAQRGWLGKLLSIVGTKPVHAVPTAWDWKFGRMSGEHALITFKDGTKIGCYISERSFISSEPGERDLYAELVYEIAEDNTWHLRQKSVLITHGEISMIEFYKTGEPYNEAEDKRLHTIASEATRRTSANGDGRAAAPSASE